MISKERMSELALAFKRVRNQHNWKNPVNKCLSPIPDKKTLDDIIEAVDIFTGDKPRVIVNESYVTIVAEGFYNNHLHDPPNIKDPNDWIIPDQLNDCV